jgi:hypothetical protein
MNRYESRPFDQFQRGDLERWDKANFEWTGKGNDFFPGLLQKILGVLCASVVKK